MSTARNKLISFDSSFAYAPSQTDNVAFVDATSIIIINNGRNSVSFELVGNGEIGRIPPGTDKEFNSFGGAITDTVILTFYAPSNVSVNWVEGAGGGSSDITIVGDNVGLAKDVNLQGIVQGYEVLLDSIDSGITPVFPIDVGQLRATAGIGTPDFKSDLYTNPKTINSLSELVLYWNKHILFYKMVYSPGIEDRFYLRPGTMPLPDNINSPFNLISFSKLPPNSIGRIYRANVFIDAVLPLSGISNLNIAQDQTNDYLVKKNTGKIIDLLNPNIGPLLSFPMIGFNQIIIDINGTIKTYTFDPVDISDNKALSKKINIEQTDLYFEASISVDEILFTGGAAAAEDVNSISILYSTNNSVYTTFANSEEIETGALHVISDVLKTIEQLIRSISNTPLYGPLKIFKGEGIVVNSLPVPVGSMGKISMIKDLENGDIRFELDGTTPDIDSPTISRRTDDFEIWENVDLSKIKLAGTVAASKYYLIYNEQIN